MLLTSFACGIVSLDVVKLVNMDSKSTFILFSPLSSEGDDNSTGKRVMLQLGLDSITAFLASSSGVLYLALRKSTLSEHSTSFPPADGLSLQSSHSS